jgi:RNA polymerase sigma factor (sigma-70 family)
MTSDLELLDRFAREKSQDAFTELVKRHVNLVYSAALRQVRSPQLAEEIAQSVFADLARVAATPLSPPSLTPWLFTVTRRTAVDVIRQESRRQLREQIAVEMNAMNAADADWTHIEPLLDEAVSALDDTDRAAVLLRYFENQSLREVGAQLGVSDDAAQKRVSRAVERLREFFAKRGVSVGAGGLVVVISANAVQAAPAGLAVTISAAALAGTAVSTATVIAATAKTITMTTLQKTVITAAFVAAAGTGIFEARQAAHLRDQVQTLQQQQAPLAEQIQQSLSALNGATNRLADLLAENLRLKSNPHEAELLKLRGEIGRVQQNYNNLLKENQALQANAVSSESTNEILAYDRAILLKQHATDAAGIILDAIRKYASKNDGRRPDALEQLLISGDLKTTNFAGNLALNDFELAAAGSTNFQGKEILLQLRAPIRNPGDQPIMVEGGIAPEGTPFTEIYGVSE